MTNELRIIPDFYGCETQNLLRSTYNDSRALAATTAENYTVPAGVRFLRIMATVAIWLRWGGTATIPTDVSDGTAPMFIPALTPVIIDVTPGDVISMICASTCTVGISCFK